MIKLFRNIRKKLAAENKIPAYLRYAIGEIVLVVIGILIALQINNWNENRKKSLQEVYYLNQLLEDFKYNKSMVKWHINFNKFQMENAILLLKSLKNDSLNETESKNWYYALSHLWFLPHYSFNDNSWQELKSTGNIGLIHNKVVVQKIAEFYSIIENAYDLENEWGQFNLDYRKKINSILEPELRVKILKNLADGGSIKNDLNVQFPPIEKYLPKLKSIQGIEGLISDIQINRQVGYYEIYTNLELGIDTIISLLKKENNIKHD